jgi:hypothetical protein
MTIEQKGIAYITACDYHSAVDVTYVSCHSDSVFAAQSGFREA